MSSATISLRALLSESVGCNNNNGRLLSSQGHDFQARNGVTLLLIVLLLGLMSWLMCLLWMTHWCTFRRPPDDNNEEGEHPAVHHHHNPHNDNHTLDDPLHDIWTNPRMLREHYRRTMAHAAARRELSPERRYVKQEELRLVHLRRHLPFRIVEATNGEAEQETQPKHQVPPDDCSSSKADIIHHSSKTESPPQDVEECGDGDSSSSCCSICLASFHVGEKVAQAELCGHEFHFECLLGWLTLQRTCPVCRTIVLASDCHDKPREENEEEDESPA